MVFIYEQVEQLKRSLNTKAEEMSGMGMVMVHDLLVVTNDFLSDKNRARESDAAARKGAGESLYHKMHSQEQRQREKRVGTKATSSDVDFRVDSSFLASKTVPYPRPMKESARQRGRRINSSS